jgi:hypothetical protein
MKTIALFVHQPHVSIQSDNGIIEALSPKYKFKIFTKHELEENYFNDVDAICIGGGFGDSDSWDFLFRSNGSSIKSFVQSGGVYLGICMGGYWAGSHYFDLLDDCDTTQYIKRPNTDTRRPHAKNLQVEWNNKPEKMFFYDGFAVSGNERKFKTYARYMNGDPMAIIQNNIGIIGCHPEATQFWYDEYSWMKGKYESKHHLLLEFVNKVMK